MCVCARARAERERERKSTYKKGERDQDGSMDARKNMRRIGEENRLLALIVHVGDGRNRDETETSRASNITAHPGAAK